MPNTQGVAISALPAADLPLVGTELVPIVQGGVTKRAPASEFAGTSNEVGQPIGTIVYSLQSPGAEWLPIDGQVRLKADYPTLAALLGDRTGRVVEISNTKSVFTSLNVARIASNGSVIVALPVATSTTPACYSTDGGITWYEGSSVGYGYDLIYAAGYFITAGSSSQIMYSTNGTSWTVYNTSAGGTLYTCAYVPAYNRYIVAGASGKLSTATATNITNWTTRTSGFNTTAIRSVASNPDGTLVVAVGDSGVASYSVNGGVAWTTATPGTGGVGLSSVVYINGRFLACATNASVLYTTVDGVTWSTVDPSLSTIANMSVWPGGMVVIRNSTAAKYTTDGTTFTDLPAVNSGGTSYVGNSYYSDGLVELLGCTGGVMARRPVGGTDWTIVAGITANQTFKCLVTDGTTMIAGATGGVRMASTDGVSWTRLPNATIDLTCGVYAGGRFVMSGGVSGSASISTDGGATWSEVSTTATNTATSMAYGNGAIVISTSAELLYSLDLGDTWTKLDNAATGLQTGDGRVAFGNGKFVHWKTNGSSMWHSTDGINWTKYYDPAYTSNNPKFVGGMFARVSPNEELALSSDAITWFGASGAVTGSYDEVYHDGYAWSVWSGGGVTRQSIDGRHWDVYNGTVAGLANQWTTVGDIKVFNDKVLVASTNGAIVTLTPTRNKATEFLLPPQQPFHWIKAL